MSDEILKINNLNVNIGEHKILNNINLSVEKNKITAIIGSSGCGKSTLLKTINRMSEYDGAKVTGKIIYNENNVFDMDMEELRTKIGMVFQFPVVFNKSIYKNLSYALKYHGVKNKIELNSIIEKVLVKTKLYDEVKDKLNMSAEKLSGGQKQRLCIARSLTVKPDILILDEPCSSLDMKNTTYIENLLTELKNEITIIIVTHNLAQAQRIADKVIYMENGEVVETGTANQLFNNPQDERTKNYIVFL